MGTENSKLAILSSIPLFPEKYGGSLRTCNLARLADIFFPKVSIFSKTLGVLGTEGTKQLGNISIIQTADSKNSSNKYITHFTRILSRGTTQNIPWEKRMILDHDIIQLESPYFYDFIRMKKNKYILDQHNIYWELEAESKFTGNKAYNNLIYKFNKKKEIDAIKNASHVLVTSDTDKKKILEYIPFIGDKITVIPNCVNLNTKKNPHKRNSDKKTVLFIGLLHYYPNADAARMICEHIAPRFNEDVEFIIIGKGNFYGTYPKNVKFLGYIKDIQPFLSSADICIAPLRFGSGTRLKILEYMAACKPVISTSKGAEGIEYVDKENIIIEDNINNFVGIIKELLNEENRACEIGKSAEKLIKQKYEWNLYSNTLNDVYKIVLNDI